MLLPELPKMAFMASSLFTVRGVVKTVAFLAGNAPNDRCVSKNVGFSGDDEDENDNSGKVEGGSLYIARVSCFFGWAFPTIKLAIAPATLPDFLTGTAVIECQLCLTRQHIRHSPASAVPGCVVCLLPDLFDPRPGHLGGALLAAIQPHSVNPSESAGVLVIATLSRTILASGCRACRALYSTLYIIVPDTCSAISYQLCRGFATITHRCQGVASRLHHLS
jgi:hypothetical protein